MMKHVTFVHDQVSQKTQFPECDLEFAKKSDLKARRLLKTFTVRMLQSLSFILVRSRLQMPAIFNATWPRLYIPELRNCKKQNVRVLQHQIFLLTPGTFLQVILLSSSVRNFRMSYCN